MSTRTQQGRNPIPAHRQNDSRARMRAETWSKRKRIFARAPAGFSKQFAQKLVSEEGRHDVVLARSYDEFDSPINV